MTKSGMNPKVDKFLREAEQWREEFEKLRKIVLDCGLTEELKWGTPCYSWQGRNTVIIGGLKEYCVLSFFKGVLLSDTDGILATPGENTQYGRLIRFTNVGEIVKLTPILKAYIYEAIEVEQAGIKPIRKNPATPSVPKEFQDRLNKDRALRTAWEGLTPGRQRGYVLYFSQPKQSKTRAARVEKCREQILKGKGLNDDYKR
jgi:uncharacterized protein YdeI (YjbR/CyaY-like superfamily)